MFQNKTFIVTLTLAACVFGAAHFSHSTYAVMCPDGSQASDLSACDEYGVMPLTDSTDPAGEDAMTGGGATSTDDEDKTGENENVIDEDDAEETVDAGPALWPMILSFGALGLALLFIIVLNLGKKGRA